MLVSETLPALLRLLGDSTRLRILALCEREELNVGELSRALDMSQSRVSNHLRVLRESGLLAERHVGTSTFLRLAGAAPNGASSLAAQLWQTVRADLASLPEHAADLQRLEAVLAERAQSSSEFFDRVAGEWDKIGVDFSTGQARQRSALGLMPEGLVFADLGCGTGYLGQALLGRCARLICVDRSPRMLEEARLRLSRSPRGTALEFREGELDALPIKNGELDGLVAGMVLHHLAALDRALAEMHRVLVPGAAACVLELAPHREDWMHSELGDRHLGLEPADVAAAFQRAGFTSVELEPVDDHYTPRRADAGEPARLALYVVRARKARA